MRRTPRMDPGRAFLHRNVTKFVSSALKTTNALKEWRFCSPNEPAQADGRGICPPSDFASKRATSLRDDAETPTTGQPPALAKSTSKADQLTRPDEPRSGKWGDQTRTSQARQEACTMTTWADWSPCLNATCSRLGMIYRWRLFSSPEQREVCQRKAARFHIAQLSYGNILSTL
ncbi:unnamed protein product [Protopolystoma xenopodis]|uniref:Spondin domain-containing protein n=1 Tax=Protopolystoma xenopodis TaxID=117903 RepID=A0A3S5CRF6_9PLAT|nr:unnamed protein product [Protopolystoma xenopodis]